MVRSSRLSNPKVFLHIICEGHSEVTYCQQLNQYFNKNGIQPQLGLKAYRPQKAKNKQDRTDPNSLLKYAKQIKRSSEFDKTDVAYVLMDTDIFRDKAHLLEQFKNDCLRFGVILLKQNQNFEDFLIMHLNDEDCNSWCDINLRYENKMNGEQVSQEIKNIIPDYKKGKIPSSKEKVIFCENGFANVKKHNSDRNIPFKSDFVTEILEKKYHI